MRESQKAVPKMIALAGVAALVCVGCIKVTVDLVVESDGSGSMEVEYEVSRGFLAEFDEDGESAGPEEDPCSSWEWDDQQEELSGFLSSSIRFDIQESSDDSNCKLTMQGNWEAAAFEEEFAITPEDGGIERVGVDGWRVELPLGNSLFDGLDSQDAAEDADLGELGSQFGEAVAEGLGSLLGEMQFVVGITLPGKAVEHNADEAARRGSSTEFTWDVNMLAPPEVLFAETVEAEDDGGSNMGLAVLLIVLGVLVVAVIAAAIFVYKRRRPDPGDSALTTE